MPISLKCPCGRTMNAPEKLAGKTVRCMYCGRPIAVPAPADDVPLDLLPEEPRPEPPLEILPPAAPSRRGPRGVDRAPIQTRPANLPVGAIILAAFGILDSIGIGLVGVGLMLASALFTAEAEEASKQEKAAETADAQVQAVVDRIKRQGGAVALNVDEESADGRKIRRIEYVTKAGERKVERVVLGDAPERTLTKKELGEMKDRRQAGRLVGFIGLLLGLIAASKIACAAGTFLRRDWGRSGMVLLAAVQSILLGVAVGMGGADPATLVSLALNGAIFFYFLTGRVRGACN